MSQTNRKNRKTYDKRALTTKVVEKAILKKKRWFRKLVTHINLHAHDDAGLIKKKKIMATRLLDSCIPNHGIFEKGLRPWANLVYVVKRVVSKASSSDFF